MMLQFGLTFALACFGLALLMNLWRLATSPTVTDRLLCVDTMSVNVIAIIVLYGVQSGTTLLFQTVIILAMTSFVSTVAFAKYLLRGSIIE